MWSTKGPDGFEFTACNNTKKGYCAGLPQEGTMKDIARSRGYLVIAVQGGATSNRGCFHPEDVPRIKTAIKHVYTVEKLGETPLIMTGMSAGARTLGELATSSGGAGVPMKCAAVMVAELNTKAAWAWPKDVPITFYHMPKDGLTEKLIQKSISALKSKKVPMENKEVVAHPIDLKFLMANGHGLNRTTANATLEAFRKADLLNEKGNLRLDPYNPKPKTRWMKAIEAAETPDLRYEVGGFGQQSTITKLMERSWASHALAGDRAHDIIDFCEHPPAAPVGGPAPAAKAAKKVDAKAKKNSKK
jgi:hypothetical protein